MIEEKPYIVLIFDDSGRKVDQKRCETEEQAETCLKEAIDSGLEGYIQKQTLLTE